MSAMNAIEAAYAANPHVDQAAFHAAAQIVAAYHRAAQTHPQAALTTLDHLLERAAPELPEFAPFWTEGPQACADWAAFASEAMAVNMLAACLQRLDRHPVSRVNALKRAMVALWNSLPAQDRAAFLSYARGGE
jgi:hypothetical protein